MQFWCTGFLVTSHVGGGKTNTFHRKYVIIFHISKYYTEAAVWAWNNSNKSLVRSTIFSYEAYTGVLHAKDSFKASKFNSRASKKKPTHPPSLGVPALYNY